MDIEKSLLLRKDEKYAAFQAGLIPTADKSLIIGVRVPEVRKLAKELYKSGNYADFLNELPHKYYDENMLHSLIVSEMQDYDECIAAADAFLPYVDNWAVCDIMSPKCFKKNKDRLMAKIIEWSKNEAVYTGRFGIHMLMTHYLDADFRKEYLEIPAKVQSEAYYSRMMIAWFFAEALAKQWDAAIPYIENAVLERWTHNKAIQKAGESRRITDKQKEYVKTLKR